MTASLIPSPHLPAADTRRIDPAARWRVLAVFSLGFLVSYLYRGVNLGFGPHLSRELGLDASELGLLTSFYFLGFAFAQLPAGLLLDRLGPRRTEAGLLLVAVAGALVFAWAPGMFGLAAGRLLIGVGVSVCLGAAIQALSIWFPLRHMPLLNGVVMAIGGLGAVIVGLPLEWLLTRVEWRMVCVGLAGLTLAMAALLWFGVPDAARPKQESLADQLRGTRAVLGSERFWRVAPLTLLNQGVFLAVQNLWIGNFLRDVGGFTPQRSAGLVSLVGFAMMGGCVAAGWAARLVQRRGISLFAFAGGGMMAFIVVQAVILAGGLGLVGPLPPALVWMAYGVTGSTGILSYAVVAQRFDGALIGRATTALTLTVFLAVFAVQVGIGAVLSLWPAQDGHYPVAAHASAWGALLALQVLAAAWYLMGKREAGKGRQGVDS